MGLLFAPIERSSLRLPYQISKISVACAVLRRLIEKIFLFDNFNKIALLNLITVSLIFDFLA